MSEEHSHLYGSHSLRIGAATDAGAAGLPDWLIQAAGRWKSTAFHRYIRSPKKALLRVAPALAIRAVLSSGECHQQYGLTGILGKLGGRHRHMLDARARPSGQACSRDPLDLLGKSRSSQPRAVAAKGLGYWPSDVPLGHYNSPNPTTELTRLIECG